MMKRGNCLLLSLILCIVLVAICGMSQAAESKKMPARTVWFNDREADLEKPALKIDGQLYITFVDLVRHLGGMLNWGPEDSYIEAHRADTVVRVTAGTKYALVNQMRMEIAGQNRRIGNRTYVPLKVYCQLFGVTFEWDATLRRAYVTWSEKEE